MAKTRLQLLGVFEATGPNGAPLALPTRKSQALAAVLALADASVPRDRLLGLLWADRGDEQARHSLSQALTSLRQLFGADTVVSDRETVAFDATRIEIDARAFLAHARAFPTHDRQGDEPGLAAAAALLRGPLLQDFTLPEAAFDDWLMLERARFTRLATDVLLRLGARAADRGDDTAASVAFERALALDPLSETAHLALMRLHLDRGRPAAALRQYSEAAAILRQGLDAAPCTELEAARQEARMRAAPPEATAGEAGARKHATAIALALWPAAGMAGDSEEIQSRIEAAAAQAAVLVRAAGGQVVYSTPDGLLGVFGIPAVLEDHAARACRTALAIGDSLADPRHSGVGVRLALDSGELVLRPDAAGGTSVFGVALQRAGRIASLPDAPPVAATAVTRDLARGRFVFAAHGDAVLVPGEFPVALFRPVGPADQGADQVADQVVSGFVGRGRELAAIVEACRAAAAGDGQLVAIAGEPGIGKSRLVREFIATALPAGWRAIAAGADPQLGEAAYYPVRRLLHAFFGLAGTSGATAIRARVETALGRLGATAALPSVLSLMDHEPTDPGWTHLDPDTRRRRMMEAVIQLLHRQSEDTPLLVVIEDLHWLDSASRAVLDDLVATLAGARIVVIVNFRPEFVHSWAGARNFRLLHVDPLEGGATSVLLEELLGADVSLAPLKASLVARTGGNPFFLEECVRALAAAGTLEGAPGAWRLADAAAHPVLPETVHAVIGARVDRLGAADKQLLQLAAVIGTDVPCTLLEAVSGLDEAAFEAALRRLRVDEFLLPVRMIPDRLVRFKHALTHEVVYASLLRQRRRELHTRVLEWLESRGRATDAVETLAHHAVRADDWPKAARYAREAGEKSATRNASRAAKGYFKEALEMLRHLPQTRTAQEAEIDVRLQLRDMLFVLGEHDGIPEHLDAAAALASEIGDAPRLTRAKLILSGWQWSAGRHRRALETAAEAMAIAEQHGDPLLRALSQYRLGVNFGALGQYRESVDALGAALRLLEDAGLTDVTAFGGYPWVFCRNFLAWALTELGEYDAALAAGRGGWDAAWERQNNYTRSVMSFGYGHALVRSGRWEEAREVLENGLALFGSGEVPVTYPLIAAPLGYLLAASGDATAGFAHLRRAADPRVRGRSPVYAHVEIWLAEAQRVAGQTDAALQTANAALATARANEEQGHEAWALRCLADLVAACPQGAKTGGAKAGGTDLGDAWALYDAAEALAAPRGMRPLLAEIEAGRARLRGVERGGAELGGAGRVAPRRRVPPGP